MNSLIPNFFMSANWSDNSTSGICDELLYYGPIYIISPISVIGVLFNLLNIVVFSKTKTTTIKGDMTRYLIAKSIWDICYNLCDLFSRLNDFGLNPEYTSSFAYQVLYLSISLYLKSISLFLSIIFDLTATFDRYRLITDKCKFFNKIFAFKRGLPLIICIPVIVYLYKFWYYYICVNSGFDETYTVYSTVGRDIPPSIMNTIDLIQKIIINFSFVTLILFLNLLMLIKLKNAFKSKRTVTTDRETIDRIRKSESRNTLMLIWTSPVTIIPNYIFFVSSILRLCNYLEFYNLCAESIGNIVFSLQFSVSFIFYYSFNVNFQKAFNELFRKKM